jgi:hypothetical protein
VSPLSRQRRNTFSTHPRLTWNNSASSIWVCSPVNQASTSLRRRSSEYGILPYTLSGNILYPYTKLKSALGKRMDGLVDAAEFGDSLR